VSYYVNTHIDQSKANDQAYVDQLNKEAREKVGFVDGWLSSVLYTYTLTLGEFQLDTYNSKICYVYFLFCAALNLIVMLNLLIAVISETH
jgi:hypothetical protein